MVYLFRRNGLKPEVGKEQVDHLLDELLSYDNNSVHIVYTDRSDKKNYGDFLTVRKAGIEDKIKFSKVPYIPMNYSHLSNFYLDDGEETLIEPAYKTQEIIKRFKPRRISIGDSSIKQVGKYIPDPYEFIGFEVRFPNFGINVFASSFQRCAGLKRFKLIENENKKHVAKITHHLNDLIYPRIRVEKVVG